MTSNFRVTVEANKSAADVDGKLALIAGLAGLAVAVAVALAVIQARRLTRPSTLPSVSSTLACTRQLSTSHSSFMKQ